METRLLRNLHAIRDPATLTLARIKCFPLVSSLIIVLSAITFAIFEFSLPIVYKKYFIKTFDLKQIQSMLFFLSYTWVCFFVAPCFFAKFILKVKLQNLGLRFPDRKIMPWLFFAITLPISLLCFIWLSKQPSIQAYYGLVRQIHLPKFLFLQFAILPIYYFAEEFFFRGFLFLLLWKKIRWHSLWITELLFTIAHFTKPGWEILFAIPVGIILNLLVLWTRSILPAIVFHYSLGVLLNFLVYF